MKCIVTKEMIKAGMDIASDLITASAQYQLGGLGGCKPYDIGKFNPKYQDLIEEYVTTYTSSVVAIYLAMQNESELALEEDNKVEDGSYG